LRRVLSRLKESARMLPGERSDEARVRAFGRAEAERMVARVFRDARVADWLLADAYSLPPELAPTDAALHSMLELKVAAILPAKHVPQCAPNVPSHEAAIRYLSTLTASSQNSSTHSAPLRAGHPLWSNQSVVAHSVVMLPHHTLYTERDGAVILATCFMDRCPGRFAFPQDDLRTERPSPDHPILYRVAFNLSNPGGFEYVIYQPFTQNRAVLFVQQFPESGGRLGYQILLRSRSERGSSSSLGTAGCGYRLQPTAEDVIKWSVTFESFRCSYCVIRGLQCTCPESLYRRFVPKIDFERFRPYVANSSGAEPHDARLLQESAWNLISHTLLSTRKKRLVESQQALVVHPFSAGAAGCSSAPEPKVDASFAKIVISPPFKLMMDTARYKVQSESTVHIQMLQALLSRPVALNVKRLVSDRSESDRARISNVRAEPCSSAHSVYQSRKRIALGNETPRMYASAAPSAECVGSSADLGRSTVSQCAKPKITSIGISCELCSRSFTRRSDLRRHMRSTHERLRPFKCPECDLKFKLKWHFENHVEVVHRRIYRHLCTFCGTGFGSNSNLHAHIRAAHNS